MNQISAALLLTGLIERIRHNRDVWVSKTELEALEFAKASLQSPVSHEPQPPPPPEENPPPPEESPPPPEENPPPPEENPPPPEEESPLVFTSLKANLEPGVLLCLDFGTAMSKAFATAGLKHLDLDLGTAAGQGSSYTLPSSVFIDDDGKAYFGFEAIDVSQGLVDSGRKRLDSIKGWLSLSNERNLDNFSVKGDFNPTSYKITEGDMIRLYLAYLTDMAVTALGDHQINGKKIGRYAKRRFARPCWSEDRADWADRQMRNLLAEAQILADTFTGCWKGGIDIGKLKSAIEQVKALQQRPDYLIGESIPEPVAVAAGVIADSQNLRDAFMVVDVGAGTTDFGLFVAARLTDIDDFKVFQIPTSIQGLMQAGDKVDNLLHQFIAHRENIDAKDIHGSMIIADLTRRIRGMKEALFTSRRLEYVLSDHTRGIIELEDFLADNAVKRFGIAIEESFRKSLEAVDESWLKWLAMDGVRLHVVLTGGSSQLPMMLTLNHGDIRVKGFHIRRVAVDPKPNWIEDTMPTLLPAYLQLAVAIGGAADELPKTIVAPPEFKGGTRNQYVAGRLQISGT